MMKYEKHKQIIEDLKKSGEYKKPIKEIKKLLSKRISYKLGSPLKKILSSNKTIIKVGRVVEGRKNYK